jgi:ubiquinol-cytochrome c reductase iron-sulfur subunit
MRSAERIVLALLAIAVLAAAGFVVAWFLSDSDRLLGVAMGICLLALAGASVVIGKRIVPQEPYVEARPRLGDPGEQRGMREDLAEAGRGVSRRGALIAGLGAAGTALGAALIVPGGALGPRPGGVIGATPWRRGMAVIDELGRHLSADDVPIGTFLTGFPRGENPDQYGSPILVIKLPVSDLELPEGREDWAPEGILAYSKICTHAGCAVNLYRYPLYQPTSPRPAFVCPCHYSTFDPATGGQRIFGPAGRDLPQLPLALDSERRLIAGGEMSGPVGPSYWGVRKQ